MVNDLINRFTRPVACNSNVACDRIAATLCVSSACCDIVVRGKKQPAIAENLFSDARIQDGFMHATCWNEDIISPANIFNPNKSYQINILAPYMQNLNQNKASPNKRRKATYYPRRHIMTMQAMNPAEEKINTVNEAITSQKTETTKAEICFGVIMAISAIAGLWGMVSLMISYFTN